MDPEKTTNSHDPVARIKDIEARARQRSRPCREQAVLVPDGQENPMPANVVQARWQSGFSTSATRVA